MLGCVRETDSSGSTITCAEDNEQREIDIMMTQIEIRVALTESQAAKLQDRLGQLPFKVNYLEEQHGPTLIVCIRCTPSQERPVREMLNEIGAAIAPAADD